jgi:hypothetical protein
MVIKTTFPERSLKEPTTPQNSVSVLKNESDSERELFSKGCSPYPAIYSVIPSIVYTWHEMQAGFCEPHPNSLAYAHTEQELPPSVYHVCTVMVFLYICHHIPHSNKCSRWSPRSMSSFMNVIQNMACSLAVVCRRLGEVY